VKDLDISKIIRKSKGKKAMNIKYTNCVVKGGDMSGVFYLLKSNVLDDAKL
jgi:hypothetical protein